jgi:hypothetical protein
MRRRKFTANGVAAMLVAAMFLPACASSNTPPQTQVAHYTSNVLDAATELQKGITAATDAKVLPVDVARTLTGYSEVIYAKSGPLLAALKAYNATATGDVLHVKSAADVQKLIGEINATVGQLLGTAIPQGALSQISQLVGNVMSAVGAVQAEVARGLGGGK